MHGETLDSIVPRYRAVTVNDIMRVATAVFRPDNCSTLIYRPQP